MKIHEFLISLSYEERKNYFKNTSCRSKLLSDENHYYFVWLLQGIKDDSLFDLFDEDFIKKIINSNRSYDKLNALITCGNEYVSDILCNPLFIKFIIEHNSLSCYFSSLNYRFGQAIIDYCINNNDYGGTYLLGKFKCEEQYKLMTAENIEKFISFGFDKYTLLRCLSVECVSKLITYSCFFDVLLKFDIDHINDLVCKGFVFPNNLINSSIICDKYVSVSNNNKFRYYINNLYKNNVIMASNIEKLRKKNIRNKISNIYDNGILKEYNEVILNNSFGNENFDYDLMLALANNDESYLKKSTVNNILEMIVDTYFNDLTYNFLVNVRIMLNYLSKINDNIVSLDRLTLYNDILNFTKLSFEEQKEFVNRFSDDVSYSTLFYDDFFACRLHCYNELKNAILKLDKKSLFCRNKLFNKGVNVYELKGEPFFAFVHSTKYRRDCTTDVKWNSNLDLRFSKDFMTISCSFIGDQNIKVFNDSIYYTLGFLNFNVNNFMHVSNVDSYTSGYLSTDKFLYLDTPSSFVENTYGYNEILYSEKYEGLKPDYLVCFDEVLNNDLIVAKNLDIPILLIHTEYYKKKYGFESGKDNCYIRYDKHIDIDEYGGFSL